MVNCFFKDLIIFIEDIIKRVVNPPGDDLPRRHHHQPPGSHHLQAWRLLSWGACAARGDQASVFMRLMIMFINNNVYGLLLMRY